MDKENIKRGSFLRQLRTSSHMTERDLAEILDVEVSDIAVWETGIKFPEDAATIDKLAKLFHVTKRELMNGEYRKDKVTEVEYVEKKKRVVEDEDYTLSNTGKNILIITLSCVVLIILLVTIFSITINASKKVNVDYSQYYVSDEREEVVHTPKKYNENIIYNTQVLSQNVNNYNEDILLDYGFAKSGNKYTKSFKMCTITYVDGVFYLKYSSKNYTEIFDIDVASDRVVIHSIYKGQEDTFYDNKINISKDCTKHVCSNGNDYYKYVIFLSDKIRE